MIYRKLVGFSLWDLLVILAIIVLIPKTIINVSSFCYTEAALATRNWSGRQKFPIHSIKEMHKIISILIHRSITSYSKQWLELIKIAIYSSNNEAY